LLDLGILFQRVRWRINARSGGGKCAWEEPGKIAARKGGILQRDGH